MRPPLLLVLAVTLASSTTRAGGAEPAAPVRRVAIVIGNNAGTVAGVALQPDLAFADDDAVRMAQLLRAVGHEVVVLTRPDAATARHLDGLVPLPPTTTSIRAATTQLAQGPRPTSLVLYFAGHGDAERGTGSLSLEDGVLRHDDLRQIVDDVGAVTSHVVLDACNAFFAVHARGPGGRAWRTTETAGEALRSTRSDVGVFVSTSAEAQVWEWDQLQGGVFSHAVRSGLRGAADADADGRVTYAELLAFVDVAASGLVDSVYAPRVHARAPQHDDVLVDLRDTPRVPLAPTVPGARLTLRDDDGGIVVVGTVIEDLMSPLRSFQLTAFVKLRDPSTGVILGRWHEPLARARGIRCDSAFLMKDSRQRVVDAQTMFEERVFVATERVLDERRPPPPANPARVAPRPTPVTPPTTRTTPTTSATDELSLVAELMPELSGLGTVRHETDDAGREVILIEQGSQTFQVDGNLTCERFDGDKQLNGQSMDAYRIIADIAVREPASRTILGQWREVSPGMYGLTCKGAAGLKGNGNKMRTLRNLLRRRVAEAILPR